MPFNLSQRRVLSLAILAASVALAAMPWSPFRRSLSVAVGSELEQPMRDLETRFEQAHPDIDLVWRVQGSQDMVNQAMEEEQMEQEDDDAQKKWCEGEFDTTEDKIKELCPAISNIMMVGDQRKYNVCLVTVKTVLDPESGMITGQLTMQAQTQNGEERLPSAEHLRVVAAGECGDRIIDGGRPRVAKSCRNHAWPPFAA